MEIHANVRRYVHVGALLAAMFMSGCDHSVDVTVDAQKEALAACTAVTNSGFGDSSVSKENRKKYLDKAKDHASTAAKKDPQWTPLDEVIQSVRDAEKANGFAAQPYSSYGNFGSVFPSLCSRAGQKP